MDKLTDEQSDIFKIIDRNNLKYSPEDPSFTANVICELANQVDSMISFTFDTPHLNENHKLPILDVKVALNEENILEHEFYEKPTRNPRVILASSALSWSQKRTIHTL